MQQPRSQAAWPGNEAAFALLNNKLANLFLLHVRYVFLSPSVVNSCAQPATEYQEPSLVPGPFPLPFDLQQHEPPCFVQTHLHIVL